MGHKIKRMIIVSDIHKSYGSLEVLKGISLEVEKGEIISIVGASGCREINFAAYHRDPRPAGFRYY